MIRERTPRTPAEPERAPLMKPSMTWVSFGLDACSWAPSTSESYWLT